jgi:hypothetical protein
MISIRASKFRLSTGGEEQVVQQMHLDVIILAGNEHVSKLYYAEAYNPGDQDAKPPTCWSDNGIAPSTEAASPQSATCAVCPHAAWGSKVTPSGSKIKACSDSKKLAVVLATDTPVVVNGASATAAAYEQVFLLRVPAASMSNLRTYGKSVIDRGIPLQGVLTRASFDPQADYPALVFSPVGFVPDEATFRTLMSKAETSDVKTAIGANDKPRQAIPELPPAPTFMTQTPAPIAPVPPPVVPLVVPPPPPAPAPQPAAEAPRRRGRPPASESVVQPFPTMAPAATPMTAQPAPVATAPSVIVQPTAASSDLDALLAKALA